MSKSPPSQNSGLTSDESTHHAEQARVIIQTELDGNGGFNRERQAILKSALEVLNSLAQRSDSISEDALSLGGPCEIYEDIPGSCEPSQELLFMLLRGKMRLDSFYRD